VSITESGFIAISGCELTVTYSDLALTDTRGFVYEQRAGEGIFVYVLETGINVNVLNVSVY
jgi:hypothetical protein